MNNGTNNDKKSKKGIIAIILIAIVIIIILLLFNSCGKSNTNTASSGSQTTNTPTQTLSAGNGSGGEVQQFYDKKIKHGTVTFISGTSKNQKLEYWFDNNRYRLTWYNEDGSERLHMISQDGKNLYHCYVADKITKISYVRPEMHQWIFNGPTGWTPGMGAKEGNLTVYTFTAKKLWDVEGASQKFYLEDLKIYSDGEKIVKVVTRTNSKQPQSEADLVTSTYQIDTCEYLDKISDDVFKIPYPMETKK